MFVGYWSFIGAWLGFKALPQWSRWRQKRTPFNRFLIGNALVLIASMILAKAFIVDP
jgi:hypothetical protein